MLQILRNGHYKREQPESAKHHGEKTAPRVAAVRTQSRGNRNDPPK